MKRTGSRHRLHGGIVKWRCVKLPFTDHLMDRHFKLRDLHTFTTEHIPQCGSPYSPGGLVSSKLDGHCTQGDESRHADHQENGRDCREVYEMRLLQLHRHDCLQNFDLRECPILVQDRKYEKVRRENKIKIQTNRTGVVKIVGY